ncbi:MAG: acyl carrier protein [Tumebacillaceae bacterium]
MSAQEISQFLLDCVHEMIEEQGATVTASMPLVEVGIDSINLINLIVQIEKQYDIFFEDDEMMSGRFNTVEEITSLLTHKLGLAS